MIKKYLLEFECETNDKQKIIEEIKCYFQTIGKEMKNGLDLVFENKILPLLSTHPFDGSTCSYRNNVEGISFYIFTDLLEGEISVELPDAEEDDDE
jgi:hypothetical protein